MIRYLRLYLNFMRFSFSKAMEFRVDFYFKVVMDCIYYAVNIAFYQVLFNHTAALGDWSLDQVLVFVGGYFVVDAIQMTLIASNIWHLPSLINKGDLDYYLVRPVSSLFFVSLREFAANSFLNLVIAVSFWGWAISQYQGDWTLWNLFWYVLLILNGCLIFYAIYMFTVVSVFWTQSPYGFMSLFWGLNVFSERPHKIFHGALRFILLSVVPFALISSVPAQVFFDGPDLKTLAHVFGVSAFFFGLLVFVWNRGLKNYTSASS